MQQYLHLPIPLSSHPKINTTNQLLKVNFKLFVKSETFIKFNTSSQLNIMLLRLTLNIILNIIRIKHNSSNKLELGTMKDET